MSGMWRRGNKFSKKKKTSKFVKKSFLKKNVKKSFLRKRCSPRITFCYINITSCNIPPSDITYCYIMQAVHNIHSLYKMHPFRLVYVSIVTPQKIPFKRRQIAFKRRHYRLEYHITTTQTNAVKSILERT